MWDPGWRCGGGGQVLVKSVVPFAAGHWPLVAVLLLNSHGLFEDFSVAGLWQSCLGWRVMPTLACFGTTCL